MQRQYGDVSYLDNIPKAKYIEEIKADREGYITSLDAEICGKVSIDLGAGRLKKEDGIDHLAGIVLEKKIGDKVNVGDTLAYIHTNRESEIEKAKVNLKLAYVISERKPDKYEHILGIL